MQNFYKKNNVKILICVDMTNDHEQVIIFQENEIDQNYNH